MLLKGEDVAARGVAASLLRNVGLNLWGLGATIVGLQVPVCLLCVHTKAAYCMLPATDRSSQGSGRQTVVS